MVQSCRVPVGRVVRTHGLRGAVKVIPYGESLGLLKPGDRVFLPVAPDGGWGAFELRSMRPQGGCLIIQLAELNGVEAAKSYVGSEVFLTEEQLSPPAEGEYYHYQLVGLRVETVRGEALGTIRGIIETGSNDVYVIDGQRGEILIPAIEEIICKIDLPGGSMVVDPPEGWIDGL